MNASAKSFWITTAVYWLAIFMLTHLPAHDIPPVPISDKVEHMTAYGLLGILLFASFRSNGRSIGVTAFFVIAIGLLYGVADELLQIPVGRSCDIRDWYADASGIAIATIICTSVELLGRRKAKDRAESPND